MNFKSFEKDLFMGYLRKYGFTDADDDAFVRVVLVLEVLVYNMLNNVSLVTNFMNVKTISQKHFDLVNNIINEYQKTQDKHTSSKASSKTTTTSKKQKATQESQHKSHQQGGATVLPSEYFGYDSGRYFPEGSLALDMEQPVMSTDEFARTGLHMMTAGAKGKKGHSPVQRLFISDVQIKFLVDSYKTDKSVDIRVSKVAIGIIIKALVMNLNLLLSHIKKSTKDQKTKKLTLKMVSFEIARQFPYMAYILKKKATI